jgi:hypothetical protein
MNARARADDRVDRLATHVRARNTIQARYGARELESVSDHRPPSIALPEADAP